MKLSISMTRSERILGWLFFAAQLLVLPVILVLFNELFSLGLTNAELNVTMYSMNLLITLGIFHRFLWQSLRLSLAQIWYTLRAALLGFLIYYAGNVLVQLLFGIIAPTFSNVNDETIMAAAREQFSLMAIGTVLLVPLVEEVLYRGLVFRSLQGKSRIAGYIVSIVVFAAIHVVGYIGTADPLTLVLCFVQYWPAGFALAWAYERADSIIAPILIHMTVNQIAISTLR